MENSWYSLEVAWGWVFGLLIGAAALAFFLYSKKGLPWSRNVSILLGFLRMLSLFLTAFLLLEPYLNFSQNTVEKPKVIIAIDDSRSMAVRTSEGRIDSLKQWILSAPAQLENQDIEVAIVALGTSSEDSIQFKHEATNLGRLIQTISETYQDENLAAVLLVSDGVVNEGALPQFQPLPFPIYALGVGDTIPPKDVSISRIRHNKIAFQGNRFPVQVEIYQYGFGNQPVKVSIREGANVVAEQVITLSRAQVGIEFTLAADKPGLRRLVATVSPVTGEITTENNEMDFFIQVVEGKERILIVADAPHPDISAIRSALASSENYEVEVYIPGVTKEPQKKDFNLIIEHGAFSKTQPASYPKVARWYILSERSNVDRASLELPFFKYRPIDASRDRVRPAFQRSFSKFRLSDDHISHFRDFPPLSVPFGEYRVTGPSEVLLNQQVGSVDSGKPLMAFYDDGTTKAAITMGSGFWIWRLQESASHQSSPLFDELILKTVQYLSIRSDKKRFSARPRQTSFKENEAVFVDTEVYDAVFDRVYGNTIQLTLTNDSGARSTYEIVDNPSYNAFQLGILPPGIYEYAAVTTQSGERMTEKGQFAVKKVQLESIELTADHGLLRQLSENSGGTFYSYEQRQQLMEEILSKEFKSKIETSNHYQPVAKLWQLMVLIFFLLGLEWFLRKYFGAY